MKENYTELYPNNQVAQNVGNYSFEHSTPLPQHIIDLHAKFSSHERADFMISPFQTQYQVWMAKTIGAKRVLEIGCFIGFSASGWSHAVGPDGRVTSLEYEPEYAKIAQENWAQAGIKNCEVIVGAAKETLPKLAADLKEPYDLIFIDADKVTYPTYLEQILSHSTPTQSTTRLLRPGGVIIADNILRRGLVADSSSANPWAEKMKSEKKWREGDMNGLKQFNDMLVQSERLDTFLLPLFDGLGMARLLD
ncbi:O-methyltransferase-like protein [Xylogone sp. PMI_703]|nr:O-methyltransferase-like protein [Xylogone sp. PMI_703]